MNGLPTFIRSLRDQILCRISTHYPCSPVAQFSDSNGHKPPLQGFGKAYPWRTF